MNFKMSLKEIDECSVDKLFNNCDSDQKCVDRLFNSSDFISKPIKSKTCTIEENIVQLHHSFGYDCCSRIFNICAADDHTVIYAAGAYINMFDIDNGSLSFRKCAGNGGIGHIAKNPTLNHLAVGENCSSPLIIVYDWPTFEIINVLRGSAERRINWLTYSKNGEYLCSQGGGPDNTLTIWDWRNSKIVLRAECYTRDVCICEFSNFSPDNLVTAGSEHIKFWKMANTFTGLKLQGKLGRFGKTEMSNIIGIFSMPDEKVISGCEWGNILVWDEELIDVQVMRKDRKPCHLAPIIMFLYSEHDMELTSVSMDGTIKFWYYRTVNAADPPEDDRVLEMEPSFTINVQDSVGTARIMGMCKIDGDPNSHDYFIQDGNGGIWLADVRVAANAKPLKRLAKFHGNVITSLQASPIGYFIATTSLDGWFHVYDVVNKNLLFMHDFKVPITALIWLPLKIASSGSIFVIGFETGILKIVSVLLREVAIEDKTLSVTEVQTSKPHTSSIRHLTVNNGADILVCGSDDCSIFIYKMKTVPIKLSPIGMYSLPGKVTFIHWKPSENQTALISCASGHIVEVDIPISRPLYTKESFLLKLKSRVIKTVSIKSKPDHDLPNKLDPKTRKKEKSNESEEKLMYREENADDKVDGELFFNESCVDDEPPQVFDPLISSSIFFAIYTPSEKTLWVSIDGCDAGYLYEYDFNASEPISAIAIPDKISTPLTAITIIGIDPLTILMGFADGRIRITNVKVENISDFSDYIEYPIHDNNRGTVKLCFSQDNHMLYTYGDDGNIFSLMFQCDYSVVEKCMISVSDLPQSPELNEEDIIIATKEDLELSLEERKINEEKRKALNLANAEKDKISCLLYELKEKFKQVLISNKSLPEPLQFPHEYFQFDERIKSSLIEQEQSEMDKLHLKLSFDYEKSLLRLKKIKNYFVDPIITSTFEVKAVLKDVGVKTIYHEVRQNVFSSLVKEYASKKNPKRYLEELKDSNSRRRRKSTLEKSSIDGQINKVTESEIFLRNVREMYPSLPKKIQSAIDKFASRIDFENKEILKIKNMYNEKPNDVNIEEEAILNNAWETIGNFNLKTASDFKPSEDKNILMENKFEQYNNVQDEIYNLKSSFNEKVFDLRQSKIKLIHDYKQFKMDVHMIQNELDDPDVTTPPNFPKVLIDESIDSELIDSFEPICHLDSMYLILNPEKNNLYSKKKSEDKPTHLETIMKQMRKEKLKHRHDCLHESMLTKINMFDDHLIKLETTRKDIKYRITFLDLFALTLEEELLILNDFDLLEDEYCNNVNLKTVKQNEKINQIRTIQDDIKHYNKIIENKSNKLIDIQHTFEMEVRNTKFAKHLRKIFKKKFKTPKVKSYDDDCESLSSSSSDVSEDSDTESVKNESGDSLTTLGRLAMFDENVMPEDCDPKLFALTFELRSQRHKIEQSIGNIKKKVEVSNKILSTAHTELDTINDELNKNQNELEAYRIKKQLKLNDVETTILLNKSQMAKAKLLKNSILVYGNVMQVLMNRVAELKEERKDIKKTYKNERSLAKQLRTEINMTEHVLKNYKVAIKDELMKKFRMETEWNFLDDMEMAIINCMIIEAKSNAEEIEERFIKEVKCLENQIRAHQEILTDLLRSHTVKSITLKAVREGIHQLEQSLAIQQKNSKKIEDLSIDNTYSSDIAALKNVYNTLSKRKQDICKEIESLKYKGKMFPPILKQQCSMVKDHLTDDQFLVTPSVQEESEDSWTIDEEEEAEEEEEEEEESYNMEFNVEQKLQSKKLSK